MEECNIYREKILEDLKNGDKYAFKVIFDSYHKRLYPFVFSMTKSSPATEDILQEVFLKIWLHRETLDSQNSLSPYIFTIARNLTYNYLRSVANNEQLKRQMWENLSVLDRKTENLLQFKEYENILSAILTKLPEQKMKIFILSKRQGKSNQEIAELLEISPKTVKNHLWKALQLIRVQLQPYIAHVLMVCLPLFG